VTPEFLQLVDDAVAASQGKYVNRTQLIRDAVEHYARFIKEGGLKLAIDQEQDKISPEEEQYKLSVEKTLDLIKEWEIDDSLSVFGEDIEQCAKELAAEIKKKHVQKEVWRDSMVQKAMRKKLEDNVYPKGMWDGKRRFRKKMAREWVEALRKHLDILRAAAKELIEDPERQNLEPYQEWL
jgi:hypothetical protein